jgi:hypothetical protein
MEALESELFHVARSLCEVAAAWHYLGSTEKFECLIEQASDLLTERARRLARQHIRLAQALQ